MTTARIDYHRVLAALEADAAALRDRYHESVERRLGTAQPRTPLREAMWDGDPDNVAWKKSELERARELAEFGNVSALAEEARDLRP